MKKIILLLFVSLFGLVSQASRTSFNSNSFGFWNSSNADYHVSPVKVTSLMQYESIIGKESPCVVFFTAAWCGPCKIVNSQVEQLANEHKNIIFLIVDVDELPAIATKYCVTEVPTMLFLDKTGNKIASLAGVKSMQIYEEYILKIDN